MSLLTWITEKELKNRGDEFCSKKNMKIGGEKMRNANGQQGENRRRSEKKTNRNTSSKTFGEHIRHFLHKICSFTL